MQTGGGSCGGPQQNNELFSLIYQFTNVRCQCQVTLHREHCSACENKCRTSSVALLEFVKSDKNCSSDLTSNLGLASRLQIYNRKLWACILRNRHLPGKGALIKRFNYIMGNIGSSVFGAYPILIIPFWICPLWVPQLYRSSTLNHWCAL